LCERQDEGSDDPRADEICPDECACWNQAEEKGQSECPDRGFKGVTVPGARQAERCKSRHSSHYAGIGIDQEQVENRELDRQIPWGAFRNAGTDQRLPSRSMTYTDYDRLKWQVLDDSPHLHTISIAFQWANEITQDPGERQSLATRAVLDLLDAGFIYCFYASLDDGYARPDEFEPASRAEVELELARPDDYVPADGKLMWIRETNQGLTFLDTLPAKAFLRPPPAGVLEDRRTHKH
jgi:hypothetical protein